MEENKKDILKKGLMKTDVDFTSKLMDKIDVDETALSNVLSKHGSVPTSSDFTASLMGQLEGKSPAIPYSPAISRKAWIGVAAVSIGVICLSLFSGTESFREFGIEKSFQNFAGGVATFFSSGSIFNYLVLGGLVLSLGLFIEQRVSKKA